MKMSLCRLWMALLLKIWRLFDEWFCRKKKSVVLHCDGGHFYEFLELLTVWLRHLLSEVKLVRLKSYKPMFQLQFFINSKSKTKGGLISERFSRWLKSDKKRCQTHFLFRWIELRIVIWHIFLKIGSKVKNSLRLRQLYQNQMTQTSLLPPQCTVASKCLRKIHFNTCTYVLVTPLAALMHR